MGSIESPPRCPDLVELERLAAGESVSEFVRVHAAACPACGGRMAEIGERDRFLRGFAGLNPVAGAVGAVRMGDSAGEASTLSPVRPKAAPVAVPIPERIGTIELVRELGRGGMGVVWLGRDAMLEREVAVKFLQHVTPSAEDPQYRMFVEGARLASQVRSTHLTEIYSAGVHDGMPYVVMEYSSGRPLSAILREHGPLGVPAMLSVIGAVCEAAAELHEHGIVHGDIKPSNVLVEGDGRVVVTDFGLTVSRPREQISEGSRTIGGTPSYMSPELLEGTATYQSDVYAIGVMMYELLSGRVPFSGSPAQVSEQQRTEVLRWTGPSGNVPEEWRPVIERAMHHRVRVRAKSARHLLDAVNRVCPDARIWSRGHRELRLAASPGGVGTASTEQGSRFGTTYYEALAELSRQRAKASPGAGTPDEIRPPPLEAVAARTENVVGVSIPCIGCGYELAGLPLDGQCPECGVRLEVSHDPIRLCFADPAWLTRVARGASVVLMIPVIMVIAGIMPVFFVALGYAQPMYATIGLTVALLAGAAVLATPREPKAPEPWEGERRDHWSRRALRWASLLWLVVSVAAIVGTLSDPVAFTPYWGVQGDVPENLLVLGVPRTFLIQLALWSASLAGAIGTCVCWLVWSGWLLIRGWSPVDGLLPGTSTAERIRQARRRLWRVPLWIGQGLLVPFAALTIIYSRGNNTFLQSAWMAVVITTFCGVLAMFVGSFMRAMVLRRVIRCELAVGRVCRAGRRAAGLPAAVGPAVPEGPRG